MKIFEVILKTLNKESGEKGTWKRQIPATDTTDAVTHAMDTFFAENKGYKAGLLQVIEPNHHKGETVLEIRSSL